MVVEEKGLNIQRKALNILSLSLRTLFVLSENNLIICEIGVDPQHIANMHAIFYDFLLPDPLGYSICF